MSERQTIDLSADPMALSKIMETDHVIRVHLDGTVSHPEGVHAPEVNLSTDDDGQILAEHEAAMIEELARAGWSLMSGYTAQYLAGNTPIMHTSEFIGGGMAEEILEAADLGTPRDYVALAVEVESEVCPEDAKGCTLNGDRCDYCRDNGRETEDAGWMVAYRDVEIPSVEQVPNLVVPLHVRDLADGRLGSVELLELDGEAPSLLVRWPDGSPQSLPLSGMGELFAPAGDRRQPPPNRWVAGSRVRFVGRNPLGREGGVINEVHMDTRQVDITWDNGVQQYKSFGDLGAIWVFDNKASS